MFLCSGLSSYMLLVLLLGLASPQMMTSAAKNDGSIDGLSGVTFDHDVVSDQADDELSTGDFEFGLCIPQDRLEDVDFSPKFDDDWIRVDDPAFEDGEIQSNVAANSSGEEQNSRENPSNFENSRDSIEKPLNFENSRDYAEEYERKLPFHNKKPRTKKSRIENRNRTFEVLRRGTGKRSAAAAAAAAVNSDSRERKNRCTHCQAEDTPQWRLGPLGPNTLCNACGLRYKVGRLVENYRPVASPSFDSAKHSNFYKRIMRSK